MPVAAFRVDSSIKIGIGHLKRCLTLANNLQKLSWRCHFFCLNNIDNGRNDILNAGHSLHLLDEDVTSMNYQHDSSNADLEFELGDVDKVRPCLANLKCDLLVVDHYGLGALWEKSLREFSGFSLVIDDLANRKHYCDLLLDQTLGRKEASYNNRVRSNTRVFCGAKFALLRPEFNYYRSYLEETDLNFYKPKNILVSFGGTDANGLTLRVVEILERLTIDKEVLIVISSNSPSLKLLLNIENESPWLKVECDSVNMAQHMLWADIGIGAGGVTAMERCCLGLPSLVIQIANNQSDVISSLEKEGAAKVVKDLTSIEQAIYSLLDRVSYLEMMKKAFELCDGLGVKRLIQCLVNLDGKSITLIPMIYSDASLLFQWQNETGMRKYFRRKESPDWQRHLDWMSLRIDNDDQRCWIINLWDKPIGNIRLDRVEGSLYEVSVLISKDYQSLGAAKEALLSLMSNVQEGAGLLAEVNNENLPSKALFVTCGFKKRQDGKYYWQTDKYRSYC